MWREALNKADGNEKLARLILEIKGDSSFGTPLDERPSIKGSSLRVAAQQKANQRQG